MKSAMLAVVVWSSRIIERLDGFQALNWFSRMEAMRPNFCFGTSLHLLRTEDHLPTSWFFLDSCRTEALCRSVTDSRIGRRLSVRCRWAGRDVRFCVFGNICKSLLTRLVGKSCCGWSDQFRVHARSNVKNGETVALLTCDCWGGSGCWTSVLAFEKSGARGRWPVLANCWL